MAEKDNRWPFLGWMSIREMQEHIRELRGQVEQLEARLAHKKSPKRKKAS